MNKLRKNRGFTLVELIMTMVIIGILAAVAAPRFFDSNVFQARGITDQIQASLRYAQKVAIAQRTAITANITTGATSICDSTLTGGAVQCQLKLPASVTIAPLSPSLIFNPLGQPVDVGGVPLTARTAVTVTYGTTVSTIFIEAETGYVHQ